MALMSFGVGLVMPRLSPVVLACCSGLLFWPAADAQRLRRLYQHDRDWEKSLGLQAEAGLA